MKIFLIWKMLILELLIERTIHCFFLNAKIKILYQLVKYFARENEISHHLEIIIRISIGVKHTYITLYLSVGAIPES